MKVQLSELKPNEFKKHINGGKMNQEQVDKIRANLDELGLMGSIPVYEKKGRLHIIAGHHRIEALRQEFGKDFEVEVVVHDYNEDQVVRGMVVENLSQRNGEYREEEANVLLIRDYLKKHSMRPPSGHINVEKGKKGFQDEPGSVRQISDWLNGQGTVMHKSKIASLLSVADNLSPGLRERVGKASHAGVEHDDNEDVIPVKLAHSLATKIESYEDQEALADILLDTEKFPNQDEREKAISVFKELGDDDRAAVLSGDREIGADAPYVMSGGEMVLKMQQKTNELILEMRTLRKTLSQFRRENLFAGFSSKQRVAYRSRLSKVRDEYGALVKELESSLEVLKDE